MNRALNKKLLSMINHDDYKNGIFVFRTKQEKLVKKKVEKFKDPNEDEIQLNSQAMRVGEAKQKLENMDVDEIEKEQEIIFVRTRN